MITIPKHTISTYNPSSTAINEQSDFTRRFPSYPPKIRVRVEKVIKQLIQAYDVEENPEKMKDIFFKKASLLPNPTYWELLRSVWVAAGRVDNVHEFMPFFKSNRPSKNWFMTPEDATAFNKMVFPLKVYRAYSQEPDPGISWTLNEQWCKEYATVRDMHVKSRTVMREDVFAYISRRGEEEIIILPK